MAMGRYPEGMWQFQTPILTNSISVPHENFTDQKAVDVYSMFLTKVLQLASFQLNPKLHCTPENEQRGS